jgi:hypothetical protein
MRRRSERLTGDGHEGLGGEAAVTGGGSAQIRHHPIVNTMQCLIMTLSFFFFTLLLIKRKHYIS